MKQRKLTFIGIPLIVLITLVSVLITLGITVERTPIRTQAKIDHQSSLQKSSLQNLTQYVNPFIGTQPVSVSYKPNPVGGYTFPGADVPFGGVQFSPDTTSGPPGGYSYKDTEITGFSLTHLSGAGCTIYQDIPFMPYVGAITSSPDSNVSAYGSSFLHKNEVAQPGYYSVQLGSLSNVQTELTVTQRTGFGQFTYPASSSSTMLIYSGRSANGNSSANATINSGSQMVTGYATSGHFCGSSDVYKIYFAAQFDIPFTSYGTWIGSNVKPGATSTTGTHNGAYVTFKTTASQQVHVRIGISYISVAQAQTNLQSENPSSTSFGTIKSAANTSWNKMLNMIQVSGGSTTDTTIFYTSLYHALLFPSIFSDVNGSYLGFDNTVHTLQAGHVQYANFSGWDIYHGLIPLLAMLLPNQVSDMMQSLVNDYMQSGCLPKWAVANAHTNIEDGDSADPIIAEAYAFGATNFNATTALQAMLKGGTQNCTSGSYTERAGLSLYMSDGYIPYGTKGLNGTASATLEYTTDDFAISQFAQALGDSKDATNFLQRAQNWQNEYNSKDGYIEPRNADGTYLSNYNPTGPLGFHDGDAVQYTWMIPYNIAGLFSAMGGNANAVSRLNKFFTELDGGPKSPYAYMSNEPNSIVPWEYDFARQPWKTQATVRNVVTQLYTATPAGMFNNDDLGEQSSWYMWGAMGMFPAYPGTGDVVLGSPLFPHITIALGNGKLLQISASGAADNAPYVQSLTVNGQSSTRLWQSVSMLMNGANFNFTLGTSPNTAWGAGATDVPPSFK